MNKRFRLYTAVFILFFSFYIILDKSGMYSEASAVSFGEFSVQAVLPDNQINKQLTYFDLKMKPEEQQTIQLKIRNGSKEDINAYIKLNPASTSKNGVISYSKDIMDESMQYSIHDVVKLREETVKIKAKGVAYVDVDLNMPEDSFDGVILGGFVVSAEPIEKKDSEENEETIMVENLYTYTVGLKLSETETEVKSDFYLKKITPSLINYSTAVSINLQQSEAVIVKGLDIKADIYKSGQNEVFRSTDLKGVEAAPNSNFDVIVDWNNSPLEAGRYRLKMVANHEGREWIWDEEFEIDSETVDEVNDNAINLEKPSNLIHIVYICLILLLIAIIVYLVWKTTRKKDSNDPEEKN